jgi:hypothetical protein
MSNRIAMTKDAAAAEGLLKALLKNYPELCELGLEIVPTRIPVYTATDGTGVVHVQMAGGTMPFLGRVQDFANGYLLAWETTMADGTSETQGYAKDQTPMSVSPSWKSDGTGFRDDKD